MALAEAERDPLAESIGLLDRRVGGLPELHFPRGWTLSGSWERAQREQDKGGPLTPAERMVWLSDSEAPRRVLWCIRDGRIRAECSCEAYQFRGWCAHLASCWWRWCRSDLAVTDLDTGRSHLHPPWWLSIEDEEVRR